MAQLGEAREMNPSWTQQAVIPQTKKTQLISEIRKTIKTWLN